MMFFASHGQLALFKEVLKILITKATPLIENKHINKEKTRQDNPFRMPRAQRFTADEELRQKRREQDARKMANNRANPPAQTEEATREANRTRQRDYRARVRARREQDKEERMDDAMERSVFRHQDQDC